MALGITLKRPSIPSTFFGFDEPLCHGAGGLHARIWLGERADREPGPAYPPMAVLPRSWILAIWMRLNAWLSLRCNELGIRAHPDQKDQTIDAIFAMEQAELRPIGIGF